MKYFILEGEHLVAFEQRPAELIARHRAFLRQGYERGHFLLSGPYVPPDGGILIARAESLEHLKELLKDEPFTTEKVMRFKTITEFDPVQHQPFLKDWFSGK